jgi:hypothetical protein
MIRISFVFVSLLVILQLIVKISTQNVSPATPNTDGNMIVPDNIAVAPTI